MPLPPNDPRRRDKSQDPKPQPRGSIRGVGYKLLPGTRTFRGDPINLNAHPFPQGTRMGEMAQTTTSATIAAKRWPRFEEGFNLKTPDQYLIGLWNARRIPGITSAEHDLYDGIPTAEEWHDMALSEDKRVLDAWAEVNATKPLDPREFDIGEAWSRLDADEKTVVGDLVSLLAGRK